MDEDPPTDQATGCKQLVEADEEDAFGLGRRCRSAADLVVPLLCLRVEVHRNDWPPSLSLRRDYRQLLLRRHVFAFGLVIEPMDAALGLLAIPSVAHDTQLAAFP